LLLSDGMDEAQSQKSSILTYLSSLITQEPLHVHVMTSRPGVLGAMECKALCDMSFSSCLMSPLTMKDLEKLAERIMARVQDNRVNQIMDIIRNPSYASLVSIPITLTLLVHVLRKYACVNEGEASKGTEEVLKLTDVYQRALKLMVHQSDAAKFALRDSQQDKELARKLNMLKSPMARKVFQTISWRNHAGKSRSFRWDDVRATSSDAEAEMLSIIYETFQQGRIPVLEEMSSREAQFSHLSFQELMAAEYAAAIVQHGHSTANLDAYANHFLSNSSLNRERDRLAENWWMQVWMNTSELLDPAAFAEWCKTLTMDEEAVLKVGKVVQWVIDGDNHALCQEEKNIGTRNEIYLSMEDAA